MTWEPDRVSSSGAAPLREPGSKLGPFLIRGLLGRGGMGAVYLARDPATGRDVAVKLILGVGGERLARFAREGEVAARLRHSGIVRVHSAGEADGVPYIAFEVVPVR